MLCHLRGPYFYAKTFFTSLVAATLCVDLLPLFMTGTPSHGAARKACYDRFSPLRIAWHGDPESQHHIPDWDVNTEDSAGYHLFPVHLFNSISTATSLFGFWVWLFFSPHKSEQAKHLDRTCTTSACALFRDFNLLTFALCNTLLSIYRHLLVGSYFALQWLANFLVTAASLGYNCVASEMVYTILTFTSLLVSHGLSMIGTNLLCHRYLCEKARVMISLYALLPSPLPLSPPSSSLHHQASPPVHRMFVEDAYIYCT